MQVFLAAPPSTPQSLTRLPPALLAGVAGLLPVTGRAHVWSARDAVPALEPARLSMFPASPTPDTLQALRPSGSPRPRCIPGDKPASEANGKEPI